jgi:3-deoxy-D-manno-octulosonic acid kinase
MADNRITQTESTLPTRIATADGSVILYDASLLDHATPALFDRAVWAGAPTAPGYSGGRGATLFIEWRSPGAVAGQPGQQWVLRHYHRGGTVGRVLDDRFLWLGEERTRCVREWQLLAWMWARGLPSPRPVAAHVRRRGLTYTADLVTVLIPGVEPLSTRLARAPLPADSWARVGACVRRFHEAGVWHADLTAHNLQISADDRIFLLDFDRGQRRAVGAGWRQANLARLQRSLRKISRDGLVQFGVAEWQALTAGYAAPPTRTDPATVRDAP